MFKDHRKNIQNEILNYSYLGLMSSKIRIGIIGGQRGGYIKAKRFVSNRSYVEVLAKEFCYDIIKLCEDNPEELKLIKDEFNYKFLEDKHIIIIALQNEEAINKIINYCEEHSKIYINSSNFKEGMGVVPKSIKSKNLSGCVNTIYGNPKGAVMISKKLEDIFHDYDDFISLTTMIRNKCKNLKNKDEVFKLIYSEEFKECVKDGKAHDYLKENLGKETLEYIMSKAYENK